MPEVDIAQLDITALTDGQALLVVGGLVAQLRHAREDIDKLERQVAGIRKMIDGLVEMYPVTEDVLPEDLDPEDPPHPRGAEAVLRVLREVAGEWYTVPHIVQRLDAKDWLPRSSNPPNAVRTALERLLEQRAVEKSRSTTDQVIYRVPVTEPRGYGYDEEPF